MTFERVAVVDLLAPPLLRPEHRPIALEAVNRALAGRRRTWTRTVVIDTAGVVLDGVYFVLAPCELEWVWTPAVRAT